MESFQQFEEQNPSFLKFSPEEEAEEREIESIYDLTESILEDEEESAKNALSQLWDLKNNLDSEQSTQTVDLLISYYQSKIDMLRSRERKIRSISEDSRELLKEKIRGDRELKTVKNSVEKCKQGIVVLERKLKELEVKEAELTLITRQVTTELTANNTEVINGLYEVILARNDDSPNPLPVLTPCNDINMMADIDPEFSPEPLKLKSPFPVTKVQTKDGTTIAQYYTGKTIYGTQRMIFNSFFFAEKLRKKIPHLFSVDTRTELLLAIRDALHKIEKNPDAVQFETSCNELINPAKLLQLERALTENNSADYTEFSDRLTSKITALGKNYCRLLIEQMQG